MKRYIWIIITMVLVASGYAFTARPTTSATIPTEPTQPIKAQTVKLVEPLPEVKLQPIEPAQPVTPKPQPAPITDISLKLINQTRAEKGLNQLTISATLMRSTAAKCEHMVANDYWAHNGAGRNWYSFIGASYNGAGEILAKGFYGDMQEQHQAWLNSPGHYAEIVGRFDQFGVAHCTYHDGQDLTVVHFWR